MSKPTPLEEALESSPPPDDDSSEDVTQYAGALTKRGRIDYRTSSDASSAADEIKLCRAMTISALRARRYAEARAWQNTLSTALRIQAKAVGLGSERSDLMTVVVAAADDHRTVLASELQDAPVAASDGADGPGQLAEAIARGRTAASALENPSTEAE